VRKRNKGNFMPYCRRCGSELPENARFCPKCGTSTQVEAETEKPAAPQAAAQPTTAAPYPPSAAPQTAAPTVKVAFWGERFIAWLIDIIVMGILVGVVNLIMWLATQSYLPWSSWSSWVPFFNFGVGGLIYFLYWTLMEGTYGQSLGKMIMHLKVTRLDGSRIGMDSAAVESLGKAFLLPLDLIVGWILYPNKRQRLFNNLSGTIVVHE
jgi:uncharacterized RDD family membrane protein YckC